jgi:uncharacterized protein YbjQ (UPF0145 family)
VELIFVVVIILVGYLSGTAVEKKHYSSIRKREALTRKFPVTGLKVLPASATSAELVIGHVVLSPDAFKSFLLGFYSFFGGRIKSYESLLDRARREAILRMKESAIKKNAKMIINLKLEEVPLNKDQRKQTITVVLVAYGTAIYT